MQLRREVRRTSIRLPNGAKRPAILTEPQAPASRVLRLLGLSKSHGLIVFNGGTADLPQGMADKLLGILRDGVLRLVAENGLTLLTGGTDAGVFGVLGQASEGSTNTHRIVGVAPSRLVAWDGGVATHGPALVPLEPHHTDFVLVETSDWGGETDLMLELAREMSRRRPSVAVLASGGEVTRREMLGHVSQGRSIIVLAGTGRLADDLAAACRAGGSDVDPELNEIVHRGKITVIDVDQDGQAAELLASALWMQLERARGGNRRRQVPMLLHRLPRLRWRPPDPLRQFVPLEDQKRYSTLARDFGFLNDHLLDSYRSLDAQALRQQNSFYLVNLITLVGSLVATVLGTVAVAGLGGGFWLGFVETLLTGALGGSMMVATSRRLQRGYYTSRLKAERLRSEYFLFLARHGHYADDATRQQALKDQVLAIEIVSRTER
jgi:TRPM family ion channel/uncharacterized protein DUF4231